MLATALLNAQEEGGFHDAPASAKQMKNPYEGSKEAADAGAKLFAPDCGVCHGKAGEGSGTVPALAKGPAQTATPGEIFWFITKGDIDNGMPSWEGLTETERWQVITYVKTLGGS